MPGSYDDSVTDPGGSNPESTTAGPVVRRMAPDDGARAAIRTLRLLAVAIVVALMGVSVVVVTRVMRSDDPGPVRSNVAVRAPEAPAVADFFSEIGPLPGDDITEYLAERRRLLNGAQGDRVAVVSLSSYLVEDVARVESGDLEVMALLVAAPGGAPATVTGGLSTWADEQRRADTDEREQLRRLIATTDDVAFKADFEMEVARLERAIDAIDPEGAVVFGFVVRGSAQSLQTLAGRQRVRLVDVGSSARAEPKVTYRGIRPEETLQANSPQTRPSAAPVRSP